MTIELLDTAYNELSVSQRRAVFGAIAGDMPPPAVEGEALLADVEAFQSEALRRSRTEVQR